MDWCHLCKFISRQIGRESDLDLTSNIIEQHKCVHHNEIKFDWREKKREMKSWDDCWVIDDFYLCVLMEFWLRFVCKEVREWTADKSPNHRQKTNVKILMNFINIYRALIEPSKATIRFSPISSMCPFNNDYVDRNKRKKRKIWTIQKNCLQQNSIDSICWITLG